MKRKTNGIDEADAVSRYWRKCRFWRTGQIAKIKRGMRRRERREARLGIRKGGPK